VSSYVLGRNVAVTVFAAVIVAVQTFPDTEVHPLQLEKNDPASGVAVSVTDVAGEVLGTEAVHPSVEPVVQEMPPPVTVPRPAPDVFAVRSQVVGWNVAVTVFAAVIETVQTFPDTLAQPDDQDLNRKASSGVAVSVTLAPFATVSVQSPVDPVAQAMPVPVTVPFPDTAVVSGYVAGWKVAVTVFAPVIETVQTFPDTLAQPVDQDLKMEAPSGVAVSVTLAPFATVALQPSGVAGLHAIPAPATLPPPATLTVSG
jgi:hypothetical protein